MSGKRAMDATEAELPWMTVEVNGKYVSKPINEFIVDLINECELLRENDNRLRRALLELNKKLAEATEKLNNHEHYSQAGSMGQQ